MYDIKILARIQRYDMGNCSTEHLSRQTLIKRSGASSKQVNFHFHRPTRKTKKNEKNCPEYMQCWGTGVLQGHPLAKFRSPPALLRITFVIQTQELCPPYFGSICCGRLLELVPLRSAAINSGAACGCVSLSSVSSLSFG